MGAVLCYGSENAGRAGPGPLYTRRHGADDRRDAAMRRLRTRDALLLASVILVFASCFLLHLGALLRGDLGWIPVYAEAAGPEGLGPRVAGFWSVDAAGRSGLELGDRLVSVGAQDLRGAGPLGFVARVYGEARGALRVPLGYERAGELRQTELALVRVPYPWRTVFVALAFAGLGAAAFWRSRGSRPARFFCLAVVSYALHWCYFWGGSHGRTFAAVAVFSVAGGLALPFTLRTILTFPEEVARSGRFAALWPWAFLPAGLFNATWAFGWPFPPRLGLPLAMAASVAFIAAALFELARSYTRAGRIGRRQLRWVLFGFYVGLAPAGLAGLLTVAAPPLWWLYEVSLAAVVAIPICLFIALARHNLFDIDRLITAAATYTILSVFLVGSLLSVIPRLGAALEDVADPRVTQTALALAVAGLMMPTQRRVESWIQRVFFVERHALEDGARELREALARQCDPSGLLTLLGTRLEQLLRPEAIVIYGRTGEAYGPIFARGRGVPPAFERAGPLIARLSALARAVPAHVLRDARRGELSPAERAALEALGVDVVVPVMFHGELAAFVCLGEKGSGDVYTSTDLALLDGVAGKVEDELARFDQAEVYRQEQALCARLRRYVPGAVAENLESGELDAGEREVTVLFVDIRGYSSFAEGRRPDAIFSLVNRYTELVSRLVRAHGGAVVEFNGDGMMAVFGAPRALQEKERAALAAAREIVGGMRSLPPDLADPGAPALDVGVGIATGAAFVGSVRAADRMIWTALGNTTNLAARLQAQTRELGASIVVDAATRAAAGGEADDFAAIERLAIRGRSLPIDVYVLRRLAAVRAA
jgi:class 3 adenylate cyclase